MSVPLDNKTRGSHLVSGSDLMIVRCACSGVDSGPNSVRVSFDQRSQAVFTVENTARVDGVVCLFMWRGLGCRCAVVSSSAETTMTRKPHWVAIVSGLQWVGELTAGQQQQPAANRLLRTGVASPCSAPCLAAVETLPIRFSAFLPSSNFPCHAKAAVGLLNPETRYQYQR